MYVCSTTNLLNHLRNRHKTVNLKRNIDTFDEPSQSTSRNITSSSKQTKLDYRIMTKTRQEQITSTVVDYIVGDLKPISTVEGKNFKKMMECLEPKYVVPARSTITLRIEKKFEHSKDRLRQRISKVENMSLTFDAWTSMNMESFMSVTAHFVDDTTLQSCLLSCKLLDDNHTVQNISSWI